MMRSDVHPEDLPGEQGRSSVSKDVSSYKIVSEAASLVFDACVKRHGVPGWAQIAVQQVNKEV
ncbi:MAG: hypothetical protein Q9181_006174 [Wetmoreana brouardii]